MDTIWAENTWENKNYFYNVSSSTAVPPVNMDAIQRDSENKPGSLPSMDEEENCQAFCMLVAVGGGGGREAIKCRGEWRPKLTNQSHFLYPRNPMCTTAFEIQE